MANSEQDNIRMIPTSWDKIKAFQMAIGTENVLYLPKELKKITYPDIITVACLPGTYSLTADRKITRIINPHSNCDLLDRIDGIKWIMDAFPGSNLFVALADDDWAFGFTEHYEPKLVEHHRITLEHQLKEALKHNVTVNTVTNLAISSGIDYGAVQEELLTKVLEAKGGGLKVFPQLAGWLKAIVSYADGKAKQRAAQVELIEDEDTFVKIAKLQIGMAIQGLLLRKMSEENGREIVHLGTYGDTNRFKDVETKIMMESQSKFFQNGRSSPKKLPAIYCPTGSLDLVEIEQLAKSLATERISAQQPKERMKITDTEQLAEIIKSRRMKKGDYFTDRYHAKACDDF